MRITSTHRVIEGALVCVCLFAVQRAAAAPQATGAINTVDARKTLNARVDRYAWLRARLGEPLPSLDARRDSWSLLLTRRYLASTIRTARPDARVGHIFIPPVAKMFRTLITQAIYDVEIEGLVQNSLQAPDFIVDVVVNEPVPAWALEEVPAVLRQRFPPLPTAIEYRIVNGSLVLWDMHAEIVIDALPNAFLPQ